MPFSSVVVWSCAAPKTHAASPRADSDVENHIVNVPKNFSSPFKCYAGAV